MGNDFYAGSEKMDKQKSLEERQIKTLVIFSVFVASVLTSLLYIFNVSLISLPFAFLLIAMLSYIYAYFSLKTDARMSQPASFAFNKLFFEKGLSLGTTEKTGEVLFAWEQPRVKGGLSIILHYKYYILTGYFAVLFIFFLFALSTPNFSMLTIVLAFLGSLFAVLLWLFLLWITSKNWTQITHYEILTQGVYINYRFLDKQMTGLFTPYSDLEKPVFDERNRLIILKIRNKRFFKRIISCTPENYEDVSKFIKDCLLAS